MMDGGWRCRSLGTCDSRGDVKRGMREGWKPVDMIFLLNVILGLHSGFNFATPGEAGLAMDGGLCTVVEGVC
jgi:hypothetical protein